MENTKVQSASEQTESNEEVLSIEEAQELKQLLTRFIKAYGKKPPEQSDEEWLREMFLAELPKIGEEEAERLSRETVETVRQYDENLASLKEARAKGKTVDEWFADQSMKAASGLSTMGFARQMLVLDDTLETANDAMYHTVIRKDLGIDQGPYLRGFIAEQQHVNSFNLAAAASGSPYRAEACKPKPGEAYGKNSFDVVIKGKDGQIVHQYQFKYCDSAKNTIAKIREGNYNNQTLVVPPEQVEAVQQAFPGKTVVSQIGGTEKVPISSKPLSREEAQELQRKVQEDFQVPQMDYTDLDSRMLAKYVGKKAALAGVQGAALATGFHLVSKLAADEPIETEEVVAVALESGVDTGIKSATAGAIKVASEKEMIRILPKGTPMGTIVNIACVSIENVKILARVAKGEITLREALDLMGCNTVAMVAGMKGGAIGVGIGALALSWIPVVGPVIGGVAGGILGYMAGSKFGEGIYHAAKAVVNVAKETAKTAWEGIKAVGRTVVDGAKSVVSAARDFLFGWL